MGAYGTTCNDGSVEQIHLSLVDELNVCVMWNSTQQMAKPTVRYFKGKCTSSKKEWKQTHGTQRNYPTGFIYLANMDNLESSSPYCYVIGEDTCDISQHIQFKTPNPNKAIFAALSDSGTLGNVTYVMQNLAADSVVSFALFSFVRSQFTPLLSQSLPLVHTFTPFQSPTHSLSLLFLAFSFFYA